MTSGELLKERKGWCITGGYEALRPGSSRFTLTMPAAEFLRVSSFTSTFRQRARFHQARPSRDIKGVFEVAVANERGQILDRKRYGRASFQRFLETRAPLA